MHRVILLAGSLLAMGTSPALANHHAEQPKQAMFKTQQEAEAAAPEFGCEGAHRMGSMWMVCDQMQHHTKGHQGKH